MKKWFNLTLRSNSKNSAEVSAFGAGLLVGQKDSPKLSRFVSDSLRVLDDRLTTVLGSVLVINSVVGFLRRFLRRRLRLRPFGAVLLLIHLFC